MTDPIADLLTRIRNAYKAKKATLEAPLSKTKKALSDILLSEGYLEAVEVTDTKPAKLILKLKYHGKQPAIQSIKRNSKPGHRIYKKADELPKVLNNYGIAIISTSKGLMTNKQAKKEGIGGEVLCSVY